MGTLRVNYFGKVKGEGFSPLTEWGAKTLVDIVGAYSFNNGVNISAGINNVFDEKPDDWGSTGFPFPELGFQHCWETCPFGLNGGVYFARVDWRFDRQ